jgi:sporulation protein YlmC with PRC-barrel domain
MNNLLIRFTEALMFTSKEQSHKPLISVTDGKKLGEIKDLYLDRDMRQVSAVFLGKEGLINRKTLIIPRSAVQVVGIDVWLVSSSDPIVGPEDIVESGTFTLIDDLRGRELQTEGGTKIGVIDHVILDNQCRVLGFGLGKVYSEGPLAERRAIARDAILNLGSTEEPMTINLAQAESLLLPSV